MSEPAPWVPPADVKVTCNLCGDDLVGMEATLDHIRVMHPEHYVEPRRWPDGGLVLDVDPSVLNQD